MPPPASRSSLIDELDAARRRVAELERLLGMGGPGGDNDVPAPAPYDDQLGRAMFENATNMLCLNDTDSRVLRINRAYEEYFGVTMDSAAGHGAESWLPAELAAALADQDREVLVKRGPVTRELEYRATDGMSYRIKSTKFPVFSGGEIVAIGGINADITDRGLIEAALSESEARYRDLIEGSLQGIFVVGGDWQPLFANQYGAQIFGYDNPEQILELGSMQPLFGPGERERLTGFKNARLAGRDIPKIYEYEGLRRDGSQIWLLNQSRAVTWAGQPAIQATVVDITERKSAEAALRHAVKMEAVGQLTGGIAHDFNNILAIIQGNIELISEIVGDDPKVAKLIAPALEASRRGGGLTHRLLAFASRRPLKPRPTDINALVSGMTDLLRRTLGESVMVRTDLDESGPVAMADSDGIESALLHLAVNARDAMPAGGDLLIESGSADIAPESTNGSLPGRYVTLAVSDTGLGMAPEHAARAFDPFFSTKLASRDGVGLGLSVVYGFAQQSGGHVEIESQPGYGTTVRLYLPVTHSDAVWTESENIDDGAEPAKGEMILVVEDEPELLILTTNMLQAMGYRTIEATDGPSALKLLAETEGIDLLFSDIGLPNGMSGAALARETRKRYPKVNVLLTSGYALSDFAPEDVENFDFEVIDKPYLIAQLAEKMRRALNDG